MCRDENSPRKGRAASILMKRLVVGVAVACAWLATPRLHAANDLLLADFEGTNYGAWKTTGSAFGPGPAHGTLPGQMAVTGFLGNGLANSFYGGDGSIGTLASPPFKIERQFIRFLIGGGGWSNQTCLNLRLDGQVVRTATGPNVVPGGSEALAPVWWNVAGLAGQNAVIEIVDQARGGWGHITVDHLVQTDHQPAGIVKDVTRELLAEKRLLHFPVKTGAPKRNVTVLVDGRVERSFDIELADAEPDWWAPLDIVAWKGRRLTVQVDRLSEDSRALASVEQADDLKGAEQLYREPLRPQLHFSPQRGWNNDPNGLVFFKGEYHLFFQHNPYGWNWGNMHWGHAVSRDLVHWQEIGEALAPDDRGPMYSGSAVVDWNNTSGLGQAGQPPVVLCYTAAGNPTVQCLASSTDGRHFTKFSGNPVVPQITGGNRDPKVFWHEPTQRWIMVLYVEQDQRHTIQFLTSPNLKHWTVTSQVEGLFECPDFFELPVDGNAANRKWVLTAASSEYLVGRFDGQTFTPETPKLKGHLGRGFYAAQTFSDIPAADGRRIQIGWLQAPSPGMAFNQTMSLPLELKLTSTAAGPRLTWLPVKELTTLRARSHSVGPLTLRPGDANPLANASGELLEVRAEFKPGAASVLNLTVRGVVISYDAARQELNVNGHRAPAPLRDGKQSLLIYADRTAFEVFASGGLTYVPLPVIRPAGDRSVEATVSGDAVMFSVLEAHELRSLWR